MPTVYITEQTFYNYVMAQDGDTADAKQQIKQVVEEHAPPQQNTHNDVRD